MPLPSLTMLTRATADPRADTLVVDPGVAHLPLCHATAEPAEDPAGGAFDDFAWVSPHSVWSRTAE